MSRWLALARGEGPCEKNESDTLIARGAPEVSVPLPAPVKLSNSFNSHNSSTSLAADPDVLLALLRDRGPTTYGAAASALGWSPTRTWQAEAALQTAGRIQHDRIGRAVITEEPNDPAV